MTAFDTAWDLMKAPYHGTTSDRVESILREGLKPSDWDDSNKFIGGKAAYDKPKVFATSVPMIAKVYAIMAANMPQRRRAREQGIVNPGVNLSTPYIQDDVSRPALIRIDPSFPLRRGEHPETYREYLYSNVPIPPQFLSLAHQTDFDVDGEITYPQFERLAQDSFKQAKLPVKEEPHRKLASFDDDPDETGYSPKLSLEEIERRVMRE
tara:strand:- start:585 stop:1211 length:627 start_codon:yes stop_codon:yes gene_type:complete